MKGMVYLTSGYRILRFPTFKDNLHNLGIFGPRGGYLGRLQYRDEDVEKIVNTVTLTLPQDAEPPEGQQP